MDERPTDGKTVKTVDTVFMIIEALQESDGARITELGEQLDVANSTIHRHLTSLRRRGYVIKQGDTYKLGLRFLDLGQYVRTREVVFEMAKPKVEELAEETGERVQFIVEEHGYGVYVHRERGAHAVKTDPGIGKHIPIHATAAGKAILAYYPRDGVEEIIAENGVPALTENTITDPHELFDELATIRERGFSINNEESLEGLRAMGVPIKSPGAQVLGALSVSGPIHRMKGDWFEQELPDLLLGTANELELNIAHS